MRRDRVAAAVLLLMVLAAVAVWAASANRGQLPPFTAFFREHEPVLYFRKVAEQAGFEVPTHADGGRAGPTAKYVGSASWSSPAAETSGTT